MTGLICVLSRLLWVAAVIAAGLIPGVVLSFGSAGEAAGAVRSAERIPDIEEAEGLSPESVTRLVSVRSGALESVGPSSTAISVTYTNLATGDSVATSVSDGSSFVPATAVGVGFPENFTRSWEGIDSRPSETRRFASWVLKEDCAWDDYWQKCSAINGDFFDPGVASSLTGDVELVAVYDDPVEVKFRCGSPSDGSAVYASIVQAARHQRVEYPTIDELFAACGAGGSGYYYLGTWSQYLIGSADILSDAVRPRSNVQFGPDSERTVMKFVIDADGGVVSGGRGFPEFKQLGVGESLTAYNGRSYGEGTYYLEYWYPWTTGYYFAWTGITKDGFFSDGYMSPWVSLEENPNPAPPDDDPWIFHIDHRQYTSDIAFDWTQNPSEIVGIIHVQYDDAFWFECDPNGGEPYGEGAVTRGADGLAGSRAEGVSHWSTAYAKISCDQPARAGWTFTGWNTAPDGSGTSYTHNAGVIGSGYAAGAHTLYAQWSQDAYDVLFYRLVPGSGTQVANAATELGGAVLVPDLPPDGGREGYRFAGWNTASNGSGTTYQPGDSFVLSEVPGNNAYVQLWTLWAPLSQIVTLDPNPGDGSTLPEGMPDNVVGDTNTTVALPAPELAPERIGYTFAGWNTAEDGTGTPYASGASFSIGTSGDTLYAQWTPKIYQIVLYESDGSNARNVNFGVSDGTFDTEFRLQYMYNSEWPASVTSWNTKQDGTGETFVYDNTDYDFLPIDRSTIPATGDEISLYQQVEWPVRYTSQTSAGVTASNYQTVSPRNPVMQSLATIEVDPIQGWQFAGWDMSTDGVDDLYDYGSAFELTDAALAATSSPVETFTAMYRPRTVKVTFQDDGSYVSDPMFIAYRDIGSDNQIGNPATWRPAPRFTAPAAPTREGLEFKEWNTAADGSGTGVSAGGSLTLPGHEDFSLHAIWKGTQTLSYSGPTDYQVTNPFYAAIPIVDWDGTGQGNHLQHAASSAGLDVDLEVKAGSESVCSLEEYSDYDGARYRTRSTLRVNSLGACTVTMTQSGDADYSAATTSEFTINIAGIPRLVELDELSTQSGVRKFRVEQGYTGADGNAYSTFHPFTVSTSTPDVCSVGVNQFGEVEATKITGGTCGFTIIQDGRDGSGEPTFFEPYEATTETIFKFDQTVSFNNDGVVPFIAGDVTAIEIDVSLEDGLEDSATWSAVEVDDSWNGQVDTTRGFPVPVESTVCEVDDDNSTINLIGLGKCGIFGEVAGNDIFEDWSSFEQLEPSAVGRYVVRKGFYIALDAGSGTVENQSVIAANGMTVTLPVPTSNGQTFLGWNTQSNGAGDAFGAGEQEWPGTAAVTLFAQWEVRAPILAADQTAPHAATGSAAYVFPDGTKTPTPLALTGTNKITAGEDDFEMDLAGNEDGAAELDETRQTLIFRTGKEGITTGRGFMPGTIAEIWLFSEPIFLGETLVNSDGTFSETFDVPVDLELGAHTIQVEGIASSGEAKAIAAGVIVAGAISESPGTGASTSSGESPEAGGGLAPTLPATGNALRLAHLALVLLAGGLLVVLLVAGSPTRVGDGRRKPA